MPKRMDKADTVDLGIHWLSKLQSEGWGIVEIVQTIDYEKLGKHELPIYATLVVKLKAAQ